MIGETDRRNPSFHVLKQNFLDNIDDYKYNKFLNIGRRILYHEKLIMIFTAGKYPGFLWLFKDIIAELRDQLVFHDHILASVNDWKTRIEKELKQKKLLSLLASTTGNTEVRDISGRMLVF